MKVLDLHCDTLNELRYGMLRGETIDMLHNNLHLDLSRMQKGDYLLQCFALFTHIDRAPEDPLVSALEETDLFRQMLCQYPQYISQVRTMKDIEENRKAGKISALLTIEEGGCCKGNLSVLRQMYENGVRIMTLTWNFENELGFPNTPPGDGKNAFPAGADIVHGLKDRGFEFIHEMERLGIIIDVSHLSDAGFWDVANNTSRPFIASHSNARALAGHVRNLTDAMIRTIADRGGVTGINYCANFLDPDYQNPEAQSRVSYMADHIEYIRRLGGIDMIALGSDFDGIEKNLEMYDCSCLPMLERELRRRSFTESEIEKIYHGNALRVLSEFLPAE